MAKQLKRTTESPPRAFLLGLLLGRGSVALAEEGLTELGFLAETAGATLSGRRLFKQERWASHAALTAGHVRELVQGISATRSTLLVADFDLRPAQARNLEDELEIQVVDRTQLILDIFSIHARTETAKTQVELAQLEYTLPRLRHMWTHLSREQGGIGLRGPGEKQIETDRRLMRSRIRLLRKRLDAVERRRATSGKEREKTFRVGLVGYTNAGKSSLLNALCGSAVLTKDQLFSTLDATSRRMETPGGGHVVVIDTVGFISRIPHHLVDSFRATLSETASADLLLLVEDVTCQDLRSRREAVKSVLDQLGCSRAPKLIVRNKVDMLSPEEAALKRDENDGYWVSCETGEGIEELRRGISKEVHKSWLRCSLSFPVGRGDLLAFVHRQGEILKTRYEGNQVDVTASLSSKDIERLSLEEDCLIELT